MIAKFILGTKGTSQQIFTDNGDRIPVTRIHTSPCYLVGIKSKENDGYWAVQLGFGMNKNIKKSRNGLLKKAGIKAPLRFLREVRLDKSEEIPELEEIKGKKKGIKIGNLELHIGDELKPAMLFAIGDSVSVTGVSKGKGFQGVVKRHGFAGGPRTHGQSDRERAPGSIGMSATPGRVMKGKKMAGRMGGETTTVQNLKIVEVSDVDITIKGLIPGPKGTFITVRSSDAVSDKPPATEEETPKVEPKSEVEEKKPEPKAEAKEEPKKDTVEKKAETKQSEEKKEKN